jgi:hypothetical protein
MWLQFTLVRSFISYKMQNRSCSGPEPPLRHVCLLHRPLFKNSTRSAPCATRLLPLFIRGGAAITLLILSHKALSFAIIYYLATSFDPECWSSSGYYTRTWMRTETKYNNSRSHHRHLALQPFVGFRLLSQVCPSNSWNICVFSIASGLRIANDRKRVCCVWLYIAIYIALFTLLPPPHQVFIFCTARCIVTYVRSNAHERQKSTSWICIFEKWLSDMFCAHLFVIFLRTE